MCILQKTLPYTNKTRQRLSRYPTIYIICYFARVGCLSFPFTGKYDNKGRPLVYQFDDHDGLYPEYVLRPITWTTTAAIRGWVRDEQQAKDTAEFCEKRRLKREQEERQELQKNYEERIKEFGSEENYLMAFFGKKKESDTDQAGSDK